MPVAAYGTAAAAPVTEDRVLRQATRTSLLLREPLRAAGRMAERRHFESAVQGKLLQHVVHVALDGVHRNVQPTRDLLVAAALAEEVDDLPLACSQANGIDRLE